MSEPAERRWAVLDPFIPPGPVAAAWIRDSKTRMPFITGPGGSGKTTSAVYRGPDWLGRHMPVCKDGIIRGRMTVIRDNYRRLAETALKSWKLVFKEDFPFSEYSGGQDRPVHHTILLRVMRGGVQAGMPADDPRVRALARLYPRQPRLLEMEVDFFAVGDHAIEEMLRGYETSYGWCNEADLLNERVAPFLFSRSGRHPSKLLLPDETLDLLQSEDWKVPRQVAGDLNPPDVSHWVARWVKEPEKHPGFKLYRQPSGLSPHAENRKGKTRAEYEDDLLTMDEYDAKRFVYGEFGFARDGWPVYAVPKDGIGGFRQDDHVAPAPLQAVRELPLTLGLDGGGTPACMIKQMLPSGRINFLREIVTEPITGPERFIQMILAVLLSPDFRGVPVGLCFGDPSAFYGADKITGQLAWMETVALGLGHNILPAPSNEPAIRIAALGNVLKATGMCQIDPRCEMFIAGLAAHYKLAKDNKGRIIGVDNVLVVKNEFSHIVEAAQYGTLGLVGRAGVIHESARAGRPGNVVPINAGHRAKADFNVWDV